MILHHSRSLIARLVACALVLPASLLPTLAADFLGASRLNLFDQVTVVYPAGPGEPVADNRLSAERRAAFLQDVHGVRAAVAADDAVTDEQKLGHLLLLGWNNRLPASDGHPSPVTVTEDGRRFLGTVAVPEEHDLLYIHDSPYNLGRKWLVYWSRIDLELDRFQVLPLSAADWAIYRDYLTVRDGRLVEEIAWPPRLDTSVDNRNAAVPSPPRRSSQHFTLYYAGNLLDTAAAKAMLATRERALARAVAELGAPPPGFRVHLHVYADRDDKLERCGVPDPTHSVPRRHEIHAVREAAESDQFREELHMLAYERFGPSYVTSLYEGLATAHEAPFEESELAVFAALLLDRKVFPTVEQLFDESQFRSLTRRGVGFAAAGLFVRWLEETAGGTSTLKTIYQEKAPDAATVRRALGDDTVDVDAAFRAWASGVAEGAQDELAFRSARADAAAFRSQGRHDDAVTALKQALEVKPKDRRTLYELALTEIQSDDLAAAEQSLDRLIRAAGDAGDAYYVVLAVYQRGRVFDMQGRRADAVSQFEKVLTLPDVNDVHRLAREQIEFPASSE